MDLKIPDLELQQQTSKSIGTGFPNEHLFFFKSVFYNTIFVGIYIETQKLVENCENIQIFYEYNDNNNNKKKIPGFKGIISHKVNSAAGVMTAQISDNNGLIFAGNFRACPENC